METDPDSIVLRLKWRPTWPDRENDFVAEAPTYKGSVGRIYLIGQHQGPQGGRWFWAFQAFGDDISRNAGSLSGHEDFQRQAARRVESAWFDAIKGSRHDVPHPEAAAANAYDAAKGR